MSPLRARSGSRPDAHCPDCPFADRGDWVIYRDEYEALLRDRERAIETRENANAVSVRVEVENRRLREALEKIAATPGPHGALQMKRQAREALDA